MVLRIWPATCVEQELMLGAISSTLHTRDIVPKRDPSELEVWDCRPRPYIVVLVQLMVGCKYLMSVAR
jgi:hypothetical protein